MKTVIYLDVLIAMNAILTYLFLLTMCVISKIYVRTSNLLVGSLLGALFSLVILIPSIHVFWQIVMKITMCISIVSVTYRPKHIGILIRYSLLFLFVNAFFAGVVIMLQNTTGSQLIYLNNGSYYLDVDVISLVMITSGVYLFIRMFLFIYSKYNIKNEICFVRIYIDGMYAEVKAMEDTGNRLYDFSTGYPVSVVQYNEINKLFSEGAAEFLHGHYGKADKVPMCDRRRMSVVNADFAMGSAVMPAFRPDCMIVYTGNKKYKCRQCLIAVTDKELSEGSFQMILHPDLLKNPHDLIKENHNDVAFH